MTPVPLLAVDLAEGVVAGFTSRSGGVSTAPYSALNLGRHVGDDPAAVRANRARLAASIGVSAERLCFMAQVHGTDVVTLDDEGAVRRMSGEQDPLQADAMVTSLAGVALAVLVADCMPVLLADGVSRVVGVAHAGRMGLAAGVLQSVVDGMCRLGSTVADIRAVVGPAVCGACYEVPAAMAREVAAAVPDSLATSAAGGPALDLRAGARRLLVELGLAAVDVVGGCTCECEQEYFSYRRDGVTGRSAGVVMLR